MTDPAQPIYANQLEIQIGNYDLQMVFRYQTPEQIRHHAEKGEHAVTVAMSPQHAKSILPLLANMLANYEQLTGGPVKAPGMQDESPEDT